MINEIQSFLQSGQYKYYEESKYIPGYALDQINDIDEDSAKIANSSDQVNFSDNIENSDTLAKRRLRFILLKKNSCLIIYTIGGVGRHDIIDYFQLRDTLFHIRKIAPLEITDTVFLKKYFR